MTLPVLVHISSLVVHLCANTAALCIPTPLTSYSWGPSDLQFFWCKRLLPSPLPLLNSYFSFSFQYLFLQICCNFLQICFLQIYLQIPFLTYSASQQDTYIGSWPCVLCDYIFIVIVEGCRFSLVKSLVLDVKDLFMNWLLNEAN